LLLIQHYLQKDIDMSQVRILLISLLAAILVGCASNIPDPEPTDTTADSGSEATSDAYGGSGGMGGEDVESDLDAELTMIIYFDFDQSDLKPEYADLLARHAAKLSNNARNKVRLEGHADERGSREYNIGLGERRAQAVRRMLLIQGGASNQISTVSFGEERPAAMGSDEVSWAQNRRVEIKYLN
jgi:peptidoglycan-associated lipoprotein